MRRRWRGPLAGLLFFVGTLLPVLGFFNVFTFVYSFVADHYQYLASIGIITLFAAGIAIILKRLRSWLRLAGYAICVLLLLTLATLTWRQSRMYTDIEKLYSTTIDLNPTCWMAYNNRGIIYASLDRDQYAIEDFNHAIRLKPDDAEFYNNRGAAYGKLSQYKRAIEDFNETIRLRPDYANAYYNRATAYIQQGNKEPGCRDAQKACELGNCAILELAKVKGFCR